MPTFHITAPDGTQYEVDGPEGSTEAQALAQVKSQHQTATSSTPKTSAPINTPIASDTNGDSERAIRSFYEGVYRGGVEGPGQAVSAIAQAPFDIYDAAKTGQPFTPQKPSATILKDYNAAVQEQRASREQMLKDDTGQGFMTLPTLAGEAGIGLIAAPEGKVPEATVKILDTMRRSVTNSAKIGALGSATSFQDNAGSSADKLLWTAGGGILGAGLGVFPAIGAGIQTAFRKYLTGRPITGATQAAADAQNMIQGMQGQLNAAQETGNAGVQKFLDKSAGAYAQEQLLNQTQKVQEHIDRLANLYGPMLSPEEAVAKGQLAMQNVRNRMVSTRKALWDADLDAMRTKVTSDVINSHGVTGTAQVLVPMPGLADGFSRITQDFVGGGGEQLSPGIQKIMDEYKQFNGNLSFDSLERLLRFTTGNSGSILRGGASQDSQIAAGKQLKSAVFAAMDSADPNSEIGSMLRQMRAGYAARSKAIDDFENGAAAKILNVVSGDIVSNPEEALDRLHKLDQSEAGKLAAVLKDGAPDVLSSLRSANIRSAYKDAMIADAKPGTPGFDTAKFMRETVGDGRLRAAGLYSPDQADTITKNITALRSLLAYTRQGAQVPESEGAVMAAVSMAPAFVARTLFRMTSEGGIDKVLFNPTSYQKFKTVNSLMQSQKWDQAAYLLGNMSKEAQSE